MDGFQERLLGWYKHNKRDLPWRLTQDPYLVWLSEIILQQTRVDQGKNYYIKFQKNYPSVADLALASEENVLNDWQGLGYYSRARNLHKTAQFVVNELKSEFPKSYDQLIKLKGIGEYTAAAISSFSNNEPCAVVDGNVYRVLSRLFDISTPIDSTQGKKDFKALAQALIPKNKPGEYNQAIMEFGALQCTPKSPNCSSCPFIEDCMAFRKQSITDRPVKSKKVSVRNRFFYFLIIEADEGFVIEKRTSRDIWQHLYQFPLIETQHAMSLQQIENQVRLLTNSEPSLISDEIIHLLSHQKLYCRFVHIKSYNEKIGENQKYVRNLDEIPLPRLIDRYISACSL